MVFKAEEKEYSKVQPKAAKRSKVTKKPIFHAATALVSKNLISKKLKGSFDACCDRNNNVFAICWNSLSMPSNHLSHTPIGKTKPCNRKLRKNTKINILNMIQMYNRTIGGVDLFDNGINNYHTGIRGKK